MIEDLLNKILAVAFPNKKKEKGKEFATRLLSVENRLAINLPQPLRDFYAIAENYPMILNAMNQFVPLNELAIEEDALIFCREAQKSIIWAILRNQFQKDDPKVSEQTSGESEWFAASKRLSTFLVNQTCWQAVNSMDSVATHDFCDGDGTVEKLERELEVVGDSKIQHGYEMYSLLDGERGILVTLFRGVAFYIAANDDDTLHDFEARTGLELNWL